MTQNLLLPRKCHCNIVIIFNNNFNKFRVHKKIEQLSISYHGINVWDSLSHYVECSSSVNYYEDNLMAQLIGQYISIVTHYNVIFIL